MSNFQIFKFQSWATCGRVRAVGEGRVSYKSEIASLSRVCRKFNFDASKVLIEAESDSFSS